MDVLAQWQGNEIGFIGLISLTRDSMSLKGKLAK